MSDAVLLIGGGFIGQALSRRLVAEGRRVQVLSRRLASADFLGEGWHQGDLHDQELLRRLLPHCGTVVHLAAATTPGVSAQAASLETSNFAATLGLLDVLQSFPATRLIYFSSGGTIYGNPDSLPVTESAPLRPLSYYGAGKAAQEQFLDVLRRQGHPVTILRPANAYGPGQPLKSGFGLVRTVLEQVRSGQPLEIWGSGRQRRDFLYIDDLVDACWRVLTAPDSAAVSGIFNVGSGQGVSVLDLLEVVRRVTGQAVQIRLHPPRGIDVEGIYLDSDKLRAATGWVAPTSLEEGVGHTWAWLKAGECERC